MLVHSSGILHKLQILINEVSSSALTEFAIARRSTSVVDEEARSSVEVRSASDKVKASSVLFYSSLLC